LRLVTLSPVVAQARVLTASTVANESATDAVDACL
jgi:hypothetical protein